MTPLAELPRIDGHTYGQAEDVAALLTSPERTVTAATVRKWAWRSRRPADRLHGQLPGIRLPGQRTGTTWYRIDHAAKILAKLEDDHVRSVEH